MDGEETKKCTHVGGCDCDCNDKACPCCEKVCKDDAEDTDVEEEVL